MSAPQRIAAEDAELVTFAQARKILGGISTGELLELISTGELIAHPRLTDKIHHDEVKRFARLGTAADPNMGRAPLRLTVAEGSGQEKVWGTPKIGDRVNGKKVPG